VGHSLSNSIALNNTENHTFEMLCQSADGRAENGEEGRSPQNEDLWNLIAQCAMGMS
jgi:hypothetical protein